MTRTRFAGCAPFRASHSEHIIEPNADGRTATCGNSRLLVMVDLNGARSVTNDAASVLAARLTKYGSSLPATVIYRDSEGRWDQILHEGGVFGGFAPLGETDLQRAIAKATGRLRRARPGSPSSWVDPR